MSAQPTHIIDQINEQLGLTLPNYISEQEFEALLAERINEWVKNDMGRLVQLLYRIDVDEGQLRGLLRQHRDTDAGRIIAAMIIDRQKQKIKTRGMFHTRADDIDEEDKW